MELVPELVAESPAVAAGAEDGDPGAWN